LKLIHHAAEAGGVDFWDLRTTVEISDYRSQISNQVQSTKCEAQTTTITRRNSRDIFLDRAYSIT